jgi:hypothetical protein
VRAAGRKPSTLQGILKKLPKPIAQLLERELKAKAELIIVEIKLERLTKVKVGGETAEVVPALDRLAGPNRNQAGQWQRRTNLSSVATSAPRRPQPAPQMLGVSEAEQSALWLESWE